MIDKKYSLVNMVTGKVVVSGPTKKAADRKVKKYKPNVQVVEERGESMSLESILLSRDQIESAEAHDVCRSWQDITRHDELDYEIKRLLKL